jgi:hypothetical protein
VHRAKGGAARRMAGVGWDTGAHLQASGLVVVAAMGRVEPLCETRHDCSLNGRFVLCVFELSLERRGSFVGRRGASEQSFK